MSGWRAMAPPDIAAVSAISDTVHGRYSERPEVYAERLRLYPAGCFLLAEKGAALGYLIGHPWRGDAPPSLDRTIGRIPEEADHYYLHDLALLPGARGTGAAAAAVELAVVQARAAGFGAVALTAVNGADAFWRRQGFVAAGHAVLGDYGAESVAMVRRI